MEKLYDEILKKGGFTIDAYKKSIDKKEGFMVSIQGAEIIHNVNDVEGIEKSILHHLELIQNKNMEYVGAWLDGDAVYIDISKYYKNERRAIENAEKNNQIAYYNISTGESVRISKNICTLYEYDESSGDLIFYKQYDSSDEIKKAFGIDNLRQYVTKNADELKHKIKDTYYLFIDRI